MISVKEADRIIFSQLRDYGTEAVGFERALGRVLAEDLKADRDLPPYNRVAMDGIAIQFSAYQQGTRSFRIKATQAAGDTPVDIREREECIEIMTGAALPATADTVIRYEDLEIQDGFATVVIETVQQGQNIHLQGKDKKKGEVVAVHHQLITPALINLAASVGASQLSVKKNPKVVMISTGDELVDVHETPTAYQIRRSNSYSTKAALQLNALNVDLLHLPDNAESIYQQLLHCLEHYQVIILSGGVSMGKFDFVPGILEDLAVEKLFHKVKQRPGKPFWFGVHPQGAVVFALPGNPVSTFMCVQRYVLPWFKASMALKPKPAYAVLTEDVAFNPELQFFLQVALEIGENGLLQATPVTGNGSGDFANLLGADAFMELPAEQATFKAGESYRIWPFASVLV